ncbi:MAG: HEAT repeat domain-containing protein, partial [Planctomycetota bacterium]
MKELESKLKGLRLRQPSASYCERVLAQRPQGPEMPTSRMGEESPAGTGPLRMEDRIMKSRITKLAAAAVIIIAAVIGLTYWLPTGGPAPTDTVEVEIPAELAQMPIEKLLEIHFGKTESTFDSGVVAAAVAKAMDKLSAREILAIGRKYAEGPRISASMIATLPPALSRIVEACDFVVHVRVEQVDLDVSDIKAAILKKELDRHSYDHCGAWVKGDVKLHVLEAYPEPGDEVEEKIRLRPVFDARQLDLLEENKEYLIALNHQDGLFWLHRWNRGVYPVAPDGTMGANLRNGAMPMDEVWEFIMDAYDAIHEGTLPSEKVLDYWLAKLQSDDMTDCLSAIEYFNTLPEPVAPPELVMSAMERFLSGRIVDSSNQDVGLRRSWFVIETLELLTEVGDEATVDRMLALYERAASSESIFGEGVYGRAGGPEKPLSKMIRLALRHPGPRRRERFLFFFPPNVWDLQVTGDQIYFEVMSGGERMGVTLTLEDGILRGEEEFHGRRHLIRLERESRGAGSAGEGVAEPALMPDDTSGPARFEGMWSGSIVQPEEIVQGGPITDQLALILEIDEDGQLVGNALGDFVDERPLEVLIGELAEAEGEDIDELLMEMLEDPAGFGIFRFHHLSLVWKAVASRDIAEFGAYLEQFLADPPMRMSNAWHAEDAICTYVSRTMPRKEAIQYLVDLHEQGKMSTKRLINLMVDLVGPEDTELVPFLSEAVKKDWWMAPIFVAEVLPDPCLVPALKEALEREEPGRGMLLQALFACGEEEESIEMALAFIQQYVDEQADETARKSYDGYDLRATMKFLGASGDVSAIPAIEYFLPDDMDERLSGSINEPRNISIQALARLSGESAVPRLKELYDSQDILVRLLAALSLHYLGDDTGYELLEHFVNGAERSIPEVEMHVGRSWSVAEVFYRPLLYLRSARTDALLLESLRHHGFPHEGVGGTGND